MCHACTAVEHGRGFVFVHVNSLCDQQWKERGATVPIGGKLPGTRKETFGCPHVEENTQDQFILGNRDETNAHARRTNLHNLVKTQARQTL